MTRTRVHDLTVSLDGFATGDGQSLEAPMGHAGHRLPGWLFATGFGARILGREGGTTGIDVAIARQHEGGIGAEIMGAGEFGPPGWQDDLDWTGWWGPEPPFHTPTFVTTHRPRLEIELAGGTTSHFLDASPAEAIAVARAAAGGQDVRIGAARRSPGTSSRPGSSTTSTWCRCRSCSAAGCGCGTDSRPWRTTTPSRRSPRRAASPT